MENLEARIERAEELQRELDSLKAHGVEDRAELARLRDEARRRQRVITALMGRPVRRRYHHHEDFEG